MVNVKGLELEHGKRYHIAVIATDESGGCAITSIVFMVDITPPPEGVLDLADGLGLVRIPTFLRC